MVKNKTFMTRKRHLVLLSFIISLFVIIAGYYFYRNEEKTLKEQKHRELRITAEMKTLQLSEWYKDEIYDALVFSKNIFLRNSIENWLVKNEQQIKKDLVSQLDLIKDSHGYEELILTDHQGKVLIYFGDKVAHLDSFTLKFVQESVVKKEVVSSDIYNCETHNLPHIDFISPIFNENNQAIATIILRINPVIHLYPLLYSWLSETETGDIYFVRKENNSVVILSDTRNTDKKALQFAYPLDDKQYPAVQAVLGKEGLYEGIDLRGNEVLANLNHIKETNWFLIAKIDKKEIYSELYFKAGVVIAFVFFTILFSTVLLLWLYQTRQKNFYKELFDKERELWNSQEEFKTTLYSIGDAVITTDVNGLIKQMNPVAEKLTGWDEKSALGIKVENVFRIINEETRLTVESPVDKVLKEGLIVGLANHTLLIAKNGKEIPISDSGAPIKNKENSIIGVVLVFRDQTEERRKIKNIEESEKKYRLLITKMQQGLALHEVVCNDAGNVIDYRFLEVNNSFETMTGLKKENILGKTVKEILPNTENYWIEKYGNVALTGEVLNYENYAKEFDKHYEVIAYSPQYKQFAVIITDVTERKLMLKEILDSKEKVEKSEKLKSEFLAQMSHEIRSPINIIINFLDLLKSELKDKLSEEQTSYFNSIDSANKRVIRTIDSILNMSELQLGIYEVTKKEINIIKILEDLSKEYVSNAMSRNIQISFSSEYPELILNTDEYAAYQMFANLIDNAIKYTKKGFVNISISNHVENSVVVRISDTGIGISKEYLPNIFVPFSQEERGYSRRFDGNGLGLALVKKYSEIIGATIKVESEKGKGTTFSIFIPITKN